MKGIWIILGVLLLFEGGIYLIITMRPGEKPNVGVTPLHRACWNNQYDLALRLISKGADVNAKNAEEEGVLHWAAHSGNAELVTLILSHGAKLNEKDIYGRNEIVFAAKNNNYETASLLIANGSKVDLPKGYSPERLTGKPELIRLLKKHSE